MNIVQAILYDAIAGGTELKATDLDFIGVYDASGNTAPISPVKGNYWVISDAGTFGGKVYEANSYAWYDGVNWGRTPPLTSGVSMVNTRTGAITLTKADVGLSNVINVDTTNPANITQDATHRFVTDTERSTYNGKEDAIGTKKTAFNKDFGSTAGTVAEGNHNHTGTYEPANANIQSHIPSTSNPHSVTKTQVNLGNVTNDAQVKKIASAVDSNIVVFDGITGDAIKDSGAKLADYSLTTHNHTGAYEPADANITKQGNTFNGVSQLVKTDETGKLPAIDGSSLLNLPSGFADPMTTRGDIIHRNASNVTSRLALGTVGKVLQSDGTDLIYDNLDASNVDYVNTTSELVATKVQNAIDEIQTNNPVIAFDTSLSNPTHVEGKLFYDKTKKALSYYNENSQVTLNLGQEVVIRVKNNSGAIIPNGKVVYPCGIDADDILVCLADSSDYNKCRLVAMTTSDIAVGGYGYVTRLGEVGGIDTSALTTGTVYLSAITAGEITNTKPNDGHFVVIVGSVKKINATTGIIIVDPTISEYTVETLQQTGWSRTYGDATISFVDGTRTLTLTPISGTFHFYQEGIKYEKATDSYQIPTSEGLNLVYYNEGTLTSILNPTSAQVATIIKSNPTVAYVYWNAVNSKSEYVGYELHDFKFPSEVHSYAHFTFGARYLSGLAPNGIIPDASGNLASSAQFGIDSGAITDEDIYLAYSGIGATVGLPIFYLSGTTTNPVMRSTTNAGYSILTTGTGRMAYNAISGGNYVLSEVANGDYALCHVFMINENNVSKRLIAVVGQAQYTTLANAREGAKTEILQLKTTGIVPAEIKAIATFVFETNNTYTNPVKSRIRTISASVNYVDWRTTYFNGSGSGSGGSGTSSTIFNDDLFQIIDNADGTKVVKFEASAITTGNTRIITVPDANSTTVTDGTQTFAGAKTFSTPIASTTANLTNATNKNLVTDTEKTAITHSNRSALDSVSGTNTGDETSTTILNKIGDGSKISSNYLPAYVDDVLEYTSLANFPVIGESSKIYVDITAELTYRWSGSTYTEISKSLALGETSSTAYRGDRGAVAYSHSQLVSGSNPHGTTFTNIVSKPTTVSGYGITDGVTLTGVEVLTNKTLTNPVLNGTVSGTGISSTGEANKLALNDSQGNNSANANLMKTSPTNPTIGTGLMGIYTKADERLYRKGNVDASEYGLAEDFKANEKVPSIYTTSTGYVSVPDNANLNTETNTFSFITEQIFSSGSTVRYKINKITSGAGFQLSHHTDNKIRIYISDGTNNLSIFSTNTYTDGNFHKIGFRFGTDLNSCALVIDGIEDTTSVKSGAYPTGVKTNLLPLQLMSISTSGHANEGRNFKLFNTALTVAEMQKYMYQELEYSFIGGSNTDLTLGNGSFATDTTAWWTKNGGTLTWNAGTTDATFVTGGAISVQTYLLKNLGVIGKRMRISFKAKSNNYIGKFAVFAGEATIATTNTCTTTYQNFSIEFIPTQANVFFFTAIDNGGVAGLSITFDDIVVQQIGCIAEYTEDTMTTNYWYDKSGNNNHATLTNASLLNKKRYQQEIMGYPVDVRGSNVASATTIIPTGALFHVTGTTAIATINIPFAGFTGSIKIIPDGIFTTTTAGNIALASTAVVSKALIMTYDSTTSKWYPSY